MPRSSNLAALTEMVQVSIPRSALTVVEAPRAVSQLTSERVIGIPPKIYLQTCRDYAAAGGEVLRLGKLRICDVEPLLAWVRRRSEPTRPGLVATAAPLSERDALEAELGLVGVSR